MKKCAVVLMSVLMLAGIVLADMTDEQMQVRAQKAVQTFRTPSSAQNQTPAVPERANRPHSPKLIRDRNVWKEQTELRKISGDQLLMSKVAVDFSIQINGADTAYYEVGDEVTVTVQADRPLALMIYVDDGDSVFSFMDLNAFSHMEMGGDEFIIMVEDGDEMDMSPPDDGKWEITVPTQFEGDGPLWSLQNTIVYLVAMDMDTEMMDLAVAYVNEPVGASSYITGTVYDGDVGVSNVLVVAFPGSMEDTVKSKEEPMDVILLAKTDLNGHYSLAVTREMESYFSGQWTVFALDIWNIYSGYFTDPFYQTVLIPGNPVVDFTLVEATHTISGMVTSTEGLPVTGVTMYAYNEFFEISATTDETGYYEFLVMPGWYEIEFYESDLAGQYLIPYWGEHFVEVQESNEVLDIQLYPVFPDEAISGTVGFPTKMNLTDLKVIADKWPVGYSIAPVDEFGQYAVPVTSELDIVYEESDTVSMGYFVWVTRDGWEDPVTVPDYYSDVLSGTSGIDFTIIEPDAELFGTVTDSEGFPLYDAEINVYTSDYTFDYWEWTDENGFYHFNLPGGMTYFLDAYYPGYWGEPAYTAEISLPANGSVQHDFSISPPEEHVTFSGAVFDEEGSPVSGASVLLISEEEMSWEMVTGGDGQFFFEDLPRYKYYDITVEAEGFHPWNNGIWLESSVYDYRIDLNPSDGDIWVQGQVTDGTNPIDGAIVWHYDEYGDHHIWTGEDGYFELWIPQGELHLKVGANGFMATKPVFLLNQDTSIVVPLSPATLNENVTARVMDPNGGGIQDAFIYWESQDYIGHTYSGENGNYSIDLMAGEYYVHAEHGDYHDGNYVWNVPDPENSFDIVMFSEYVVYGPQILAVEDVPEDHGGKVILTWNNNESLEWEGVKGFVVLFSEQDPEQPGFKGWMNFPGNVFRTIPGMMTYKAVVPVLHNDVTTFFRVVAVSEWEAWASNVVSGMAHDNLPPEVPTGLGIADVDGNLQISWAPVEMEPIKYYTVYRSVNSGEYELLDYTIDLTYTDEDMAPGNTYEYAVSATDYSENESGKSEKVSFRVTSVSKDRIPTEFALRQNYPNPFNPVTTISFDLPEAVKVSLVIYDIVGNQVKEIHAGELEAGRYDYTWDGTNARGRSVSSGMYIYKLTAGKFSAYQKMILLR